MRGMSRELVNGGISLLVVLIMVLIFVNALWHKRPSSLVYSVHPSTTLAFLFFGSAVVSVFVLYFIWLVFGDRAELPILLLDDVSKLSLFAAALAYSRGKQFKLGITIVWLVALFLLLSIWELVFWELEELLPNSMLVGSLRLAPDIILSSIVIVLIGWVFFVRWGGLFGWFFLLVTISYALLQFPGILMIGFEHFLTRDFPTDLNIAFSLLAGGKILFSFGFLSLVCESSDPDLEIDQVRTWPKNSVTPPKWMFFIGGWIVSFVTAIAVGVISEKLKDTVSRFF
jgi:hypothetical protein